VQVARAAADLESIVPRLNDACERLTKNPGDRKAVEELEEIITGSQIPLEVLGTCLPPPRTTHDTH
jgi:hypothetical protein